jgi:virginiamycin B lyase
MLQIKPGRLCRDSAPRIMTAGSAWWSGASARVERSRAVGRRARVCAVAWLTTVAVVAPAVASASSVRRFSIPCCATPGGIAAGRDGALWFVESGANKIGRITTAGAISRYPIPSPSSTAQNSTFSLSTDITAGADGRVWFTEPDANKIGAITTGGSVTEYPVAIPQGCQTCTGPTAITAGPDGRLWFTLPGQDEIGAIATDGTVTEYALPGVPSGDTLVLPAITAGRDRRLWFTAGVSSGGPFFAFDEIGAITTSGATTFYRVPAPFAPGAPIPGAIAAGPDGRLWFGDAGIAGIGAITTSGAIKAYTFLTSCPTKGRACKRQLPLFGHPTSIVAGSDSRVWFTDGSTYGAINTHGALTQFNAPGPPGGRFATLIGMAAGPDGRIWLTGTFDLSEGGAEVADWIVAATTGGTVVRCVVPNLKGAVLSQAKQELLASHCRLGKVTRKKASGVAGRVLTQRPRPGSVHPAGYNVAVTLTRH